MQDFKNHSHSFILFIDECLKSQGKSRYWLSKQTGISSSSLSDYFNLRSEASLANFLNMLHALKINIFFETQNGDTGLNKEFEKAMTELGRRQDKLRDN